MRPWLASAAMFLLVGHHAAAMAQSPLEELERRLESGRVTPREPGYLGMTADDAGTEGRGVRVIAVRPGGPAEAAGLREGDLLLELERRPVRTLDDLGQVLRFRAPGESVSLTFEREGRRHVVGARLARRPAAPGEVAPQVEDIAPRGGEITPPLKRPPPAEETLPPPLEVAAPPTEPELATPSPREEIEALRREAGELRRRLEHLETRLAELAELLPADED